MYIMNNKEGISYPDSPSSFSCFTLKDKLTASISVSSSIPIPELFGIIMDSVFVNTVIEEPELQVEHCILSILPVSYPGT
ncbi:hypothetical protein TSUD_105510 [Trifolium subterraneum]|uniref:Uncharacterized protein n=1 Tax=Trifolium subterraneum TaxID=3900 RepID=A0A2Z6LMD6_TRISU|nr:hypothetical protein TSUD_105510 [Trifolium subterraneum]